MLLVKWGMQGREQVFNGKVVKLGHWEYLTDFRCTNMGT